MQKIPHYVLFYIRNMTYEAILENTRKQLTSALRRQRSHVRIVPGAPYISPVCPPCFHRHQTPETIVRAFLPHHLGRNAPMSVHPNFDSDVFPSQFWFRVQRDSHSGIGPQWGKQSGRARVMSISREC